MSCDCIRTTEEKIKENAKKNGKSIINVEIEQEYHLYKGDVIGGTFSNVKLFERVDKGGKVTEKETVIPLFHRFCPFCGKDTKS